MTNNLAWWGVDHDSADKEGKILYDGGVGERKIGLFKAYVQLLGIDNLTRPVAHLETKLYWTVIYAMPLMGTWHSYLAASVEKKIGGIDSMNFGQLEQFTIKLARLLALLQNLEQQVKFCNYISLDQVYSMPKLLNGCAALHSTKKFLINIRQVCSNLLVAYPNCLHISIVHNHVRVHSTFPYKMSRLVDILAVLAKDETALFALSTTQRLCIDKTLNKTIVIYLWDGEAEEQKGKFSLEFSKLPISSETAIIADGYYDIYDGALDQQYWSESIPPMDKLRLADLGNLLNKNGASPNTITVKYNDGVIGKAGTKASLAYKWTGNRPPSHDISALT